jgi:hypothetical protein
VSPASQLEGVAAMTIFEYASALAAMLGSLVAVSGLSAVIIRARSRD